MKVDQRLEPIREDDAAIAEALESASIPTLLASLVHVTGDVRWLRGDLRPRPAVMGEIQGFLSEEEKARVRRDALEVLRAYRDGGCKLPPPPSPETVRETMGFVVGEPVPDEYVPMMLEEMELDGEDLRGLHWERAVSAEAKARFHVLVIGAGMSGLLAAIRLGEAGIPYTVIEKNRAVGGTWYENSYPGCRVDIANHFYCYSFEPNHDWPEFFSRRKDLFACFERRADAYGVRPRIRFGTEVVSARFDAASSLWELRLRSAAGEETLRANAIVSAVGQLNRPRIPETPGLESFAGPATNLAHAGSIIFHSECQVRCAMGCIKALIENGLREMDCRQEVCDSFNERLDAALAASVWSHPGMNNWYKNSRGRVVTTSPWRLVDYWRWTREPDLSDYELR